MRPLLLLRALLSLAAGFSLVPRLVAAEAPTRPNVILIVSDDMGYGDSTSYWKTDLQTPFMDEIGRAGVRFTQFRVNPLCAPTRSSLMTGLYSLENGMWRGPSENSGEGAPSPKAAKRAARKAAKAKTAPRDPDADEDDAANAERRIKDDILLLPQYLKAAGYATGMFGKWHLGTDPKSVPNARGFDEFVGFHGGAHPYWIANNSRLQRNGQPMPKTGHTTDIFADHAIAFIKANRDRPFFCYVPFNAVHGPLRREGVDRDYAKPEWLDN
jgi:arylsulfatase A